jgi:UDPglucose 6-dehydrogenase
LVKTAQERGYKMRILESVEAVNEDQKHVLSNKVVRHFGKNLAGKTFGVWGLSFKPKTDDMREAPSVVIINNLLALGAKVIAYDPVAMEEAKHQLGDTITYAKDPYEVLHNADSLLLVTEWPEFRLPNFEIMKKLMKDHVIFDGRNQYDAQEVRGHGFVYYSIGSN